MRRLSKSTAATLAIPTLALGLVTACSSSSGGAAGGSNYPTRSITYISPFPPGGGTDLLARREQPYLQKQLGHDVIITAVSGGSGAVGW
ncbi:MAG: putative tricarboxylic transport rane protein, partial [Mycobacterium sp.]|nr:putative tricarboxylic transport rane protein [Mycobacterium sp.]